MIDALFGSKTRVKLLHLFLNNPGKSFYVREITRLIDEQINSVRRELANMLKVGIVVSDSADNKLYYTVNQQYEYYSPLKSIFADTKDTAGSAQTNAKTVSLADSLLDISGLRLAVAAGTLVRGSASPVDLLLVGSVQPHIITKAIKNIEKSEKRELNYSVLSYEDFYYRLSVRDKFIMEIVSNKHIVMVDREGILKQGGCDV